MEVTVESILEQRAENRNRRRNIAALVAALLFHGTLAAVVIFLPSWLHEEPPPLKYVSVQIVPLQALGVEDAPNRPRSRPRPAPTPEPPPPEPPPPAPVQPPPTPTTTEEPKAVDPELPSLATTPQRPQPAPPSSPPATDPASPSRLSDGPTQGSASGDPRGTSGFGGGSVSFDNPEFTYGYYIDRMLASLRPHWKRPPVQTEIEAEVYFRIARNGEVSDVRLVSSSGYTPFDLAAEKAVRDASPLPPLPAGYRHPSLGVTLVVR